MSEKEGRCQFLGNDGAVDGHQRFFAAVAGVMDALGDGFLPGPVRPEDKHGYIERGDSPCKVLHLKHLRAVPVEEVFVFAIDQGIGTQYVLNQLKKLFHLHGLRQIILCTELDSLHRVRHGGIAGHDDERYVEPFTVHPFKQGYAIACRETDIGENKVKVLFSEQLSCSRLVCRD